MANGFGDGKKLNNDRLSNDLDAIFNELATKKRKPVNQIDTLNTGNVNDLDVIFEELKQKKINKSIIQDGIIQGERVNIKKPESKGVFTQLKEAFTGADAETEDTRTLPEIGEAETGEGLKVLGTLFAATRPEEQANILEQNIEGLTQRRDEKGNIIVRFPNGNEAVLNKPGLTVSDIRQVAAEAIQFFPAAKLAGLGRTLLQKIGLSGSALQKIGLGGLLSGATQAVKETAQEQLGGEFDPSEIAIATGLGLAGEAIPQFLRRRRELKEAGDLLTDREILEKIKPRVEEGIELQKGRKTKLFPAQLTRDPVKATQQKILQQMPESSIDAFDKISNQNAQVAEDVLDFINEIGSTRSVEKAGDQIKKTAQLLIDRQKGVRKQKSAFGQVIENATKEGVEVNLKNITAEIDKLKKIAPNTGTPLDKAIKKVEKFLDFKSPPTFKQIESVRKAVSDIAFRQKTDKEIKLAYNIVNDAIRTEMKRAFAPFADAIETFARESVPVEQLEKSIIGRLSNFPKDKIDQITKEIFSSKTSPETLRILKKEIQGVSKDAWDDVLRARLEENMFSISDDIAKAARDGNTSINIPSLYKNKIFGQGEKWNRLKLALSEEQRKNATALRSLLDRASIGRIGGSDTVPNQIARDLMEKGGIANIGKVTTPLASISEAAKESTVRRNVKKFQELLFNENFTSELSDLRNLNFKGEKARSIWTSLIKNVNKNISRPVVQGLDNLIKEQGGVGNAENDTE